MCFIMQIIKAEGKYGEKVKGMNTGSAEKRKVLALVYTVLCS